MDKNKLYVGNLPWSATADSIKELFAPFGEIVQVDLIIDRDTGRSKGFAFVTYKNEADAAKAIAELNEKEIDGRNIVVNVARPREERPDRGNRRDFNRRDR
ncbi:hypothetical protein A3H89_02825 [Candidatus Amesbacteria bacterium RIFCSPLOWO2_02_FULL_48_11]|uniref:RRM domain-containing protein n=3 Tax=Candidatus Amesiibacteriota TaxID=1752730 RepID=A0A1F4Z4W9_9BACT|nr:MAG: hypothetical protein UY22_C0027G0011 [Candidatus Amesbacteria bacterium GW2011_GWC1_48_10]OGC91482.1 MAG: hypothetical protein A2V48_05190 [Candidatus Amesbacteria bacterium RBG_19FT_COMBO_48_16]OGC96703.1 MAG: hypothetical protein A3C34_00925 [Candidatus Amesbacteria bacterium RIFCSPHIGHO2_02_FULL_48_21]OGD01379.1 MAG: hypothetical protein A3E17_05205 [Candidatus Amesbacteria bacterium RIFCSPHIGHO2_12_FULL_48_14]OGD02647.1 MAG: hypothetical protein A2354_00775 [Candidatus Amesbacteria 